MPFRGTGQWHFDRTEETVITRRFTLLLLLALSGLPVLAPEPPAALGGVAVCAPSPPSDLAIRPAAAVIPAKDPPAVSFSVRRYLLRRKERPVRRSVRREWGVPVRFNVIGDGGPLRPAELAPSHRLSFIFDTLGRICDDDRGPPVS
jgi:hypothetical protein